MEMALRCLAVHNICKSICHCQLFISLMVPESSITFGAVAGHLVPVRYGRLVNEAGTNCSQIKHKSTHIGCIHLKEYLRNERESTVGNSDKHSAVNTAKHNEPCNTM